MGLCPVSAITQEPNENPIAFLGGLKEALQKFTNVDLRLLQGTGDFQRINFLSQCASDSRIKLQEKQHQDSAASLAEMVLTANSTF